MSAPQPTDGLDKANAVLEALTTLPPFDYNAYESGIQGLIGVNADKWTSICSSELYGETPTLGSIHNVVQRFKVQTIALGVSRNSQYGFSDTVVMNGFQDRLNTTSAAIVVPVYRRHLEQHMAANGADFTIANLSQDTDFCAAFLTKILTPEFINDALIARFLDQPQYTEAIAYLYERLRPSLAKQPLQMTFQSDLLGTEMPMVTIARNSLPNIPAYSQTAMASQPLSEAGKTREFLATSLPLVWSDNTLLQEPQFPTIGVAWANLWMANPYATGVIANLISSDESDDYTPGLGGEPGMDYVTYGDKLWQWIKSQQANGYGDIFNVTGQENSKYVSPYGCFAPGTMVATAEGDVAIEELKPCTRVMTKAPGTYGRTSSERVEHPAVKAQFGSRHLVLALYGFNGEEPFVTEGHIFFTTTGPRAINPAVGRTENDSVKVGHLRKGDVLLRLNGDRSGYDKVKIEKITRGGAKCSSIHGIHLAKGSDGGHKYHANGYWVGENYPQLTIKGLMNKYQMMTLADQRAFVKHVSQLPPSFRRVLGPSVYDTVQRFFSTMAVPTQITSESVKMQKKGPSALLDAVEEVGHHHISITSVVTHYRLVNHDTLRKSRRLLNTTDPRHAGMIADLNGDQVLPEVSLCHGAVVVNHQGDPAMASHVSMSHLSAQWSKPLEGQPGMYQHGILRSVYHGKAAVGYVASGPAQVDSLDKLESITPVMAISNANTYNINFGTKTLASSAEAVSAKSTDPDGWTPFWKISIGLTHDPSSGGFKIVLSLPDLDKQWVDTWGQDAADTPPYQVLPPKLNQQTFVMTIPVQIRPGLETGPPGLLDTLQNWNLKDDEGNAIPAGPAFNQFCVYLNLETNELHGYSCELAPAGSGNFQDGPIHALTTPGSNTVSQIRQTVNNLVQEAPAMPGTFEAADVSDPSANLHAPATPAARMLATKLFTAGDLSIGDLQTTPAPSDSDLNKFSQQYMQNAGNYWRLQPEVDVFGNDKDAMRTALPRNGSLTDQLDSAGQAWLGTYDRGLMLQALQRDTKYSSKFTGPEADKMTYYWQGGQKGCLASDAQFNRVSEICASEAFLALTPALEAYIEDSRDWANLFFAFVSSDEQLNDQTFAMSLDPGASNLTNRYCMILNALDTQNRGYDVKLWGLVRDKLLCSVSNGSIKGDGETPEFLQAFVAQIILQVQAGSSSDLFTELKIDLAALEEHFQTSDADDLAAIIFSDTFELGQCFLEAMKDLADVVAIKRKSSFSDLMKRWEDKIKLKFPNKGETLIKGLRLGTAFIGLAMDGFGIYQSIKYLQDWKNLDDAQKASAVISLVQFVVQTGSDLGKLIQMMRGKDPSSFDFKLSCVKWNQATGEACGHTVSSAEEDAATGEKTVLPALDEKAISEISAANTGSPEGAIEKSLAKVATADEAASDMTKTFSLTEAVASVIAIAANIAAAVCMGYQIKDDFKNGESPGIEAMDILSEITTCLQVISGIVELGAMVLGVECIAIPVVGFIIAIIGIILMFCEMFIPHQAPPDPVETYINDNKGSFLDSIPAQPSVALTYKLTDASGGTTVPKGQQGTIVLSVTNPSNVDIRFRSLALRFAAGSDGDELFLAPSGKDSKTGISPMNNVVTYELIGKPDGWSVQGAPVANNTDGGMMAKIISTDNANGSSVPPGGLELRITGTVNSTAGTVTFRMLEGAVSRPGVDGIPAGDYYTSLVLTKS